MIGIKEYGVIKYKTTKLIIVNNLSATPSNNAPKKVDALKYLAKIPSILSVK